ALRQFTTASGLRGDITNFRLNRFLPVISTTEIFFEPAIQSDKEIPAAHFLDLQFRKSSTPVPPSDWCHRPGVPAHDCLQRKFNRQIEVRRQKRTTAFDDRSPICLECISCVVQAALKHYSEKQICSAVENQFVKRIVDQTAAPNKARSKDGIPALRQKTPIRN